jgi:hypothetical protein
MGPTELKPCPFCGKPGKMLSYGSGRWSVDCSNDDCPAFLSCSEEAAAQAWNNRPGERALLDALRECEGGL